MAGRGKWRWKSYGDEGGKTEERGRNVREDVTAGYQRRTTKVIKLGWMAGSDRLVGYSIGNSTNLWTS